MRYYLMRQDITVCDRWVLGDVHHVDNWHFSDPPVNFMEPGTYTLDVRFDGKEVDYSLAGYASVPVLILAKMFGDYHYFSSAVAKIEWTL